MANRLRLKIGFHLYLALWCLYWLQGSLYAEGGMFSQLLLAFLLLVSIVCYFVSLVEYRLPPVMKVMSLLVIIFIIYGGFSILMGESFSISESGLSGVTAVGYLKNVLISFLPIYVSYMAVKRSYFNQKCVQVWTFVFLAVAIIGFYTNQGNMLLQSVADEVTNNSAYSVLAIVVLIPFFYKTPIVQYVVLAVCLFYVLIGMKRGAIICGSVATLCFIYLNIRDRKKTSHGFLTVVLTVFVLIFAFLIVNHLLDTSDYFNRRIERTLAGDSANRKDVYSLLLSHLWNDSSILQLLFGNGANATLKIGMNYAHNDWLEIAINNGLLVVIVYIVYWVKMITTIKHSRENLIVSHVISLFFAIYFTKTFFSMSYSTIPIWAGSALGFALANYDYHYKLNK